MSKKKESDEFDEADFAKFNAGVLKGMYLLDAAYHQELRRLMQSFGDVWASYYQGKITPERQRVSEQKSLVVSALETLEDMLAEKYDTERDSYLATQSMTTEEFWDYLDKFEENNEQTDSI